MAVISELIPEFNPLARDTKVRLAFKRQEVLVRGAMVLGGLPRETLVELPGERFLMLREVDEAKELEPPVIIGVIPLLERQ